MNLFKFLIAMKEILFFLPDYSKVIAYHLFVFNYLVKCELGLKSSCKIFNILRDITKD